MGVPALGGVKDGTCAPPTCVLINSLDSKTADIYCSNLILIPSPVDQWRVSLPLSETQKTSLQYSVQIFTFRIEQILAPIEAAQKAIARQTC